MRRIVLIVVLTGLVLAGGCTAGDLLTSLFGGKNSDEAGLNKVNPQNYNSYPSE